MELLDVYDDNGNRTGKVIERKNIKKDLCEGEHIALSVIFIENSDGDFLIQKTSYEKGGEYSSTGGHVISGDTPLESIKREVLEELGIDISSDNIIEFGYLLYDMPIRYMFYLKKDIDLNKIVIQKDEVDFVKYMSINIINDLIEKDLFTRSHGIIFKKILEYKNKK